MAELSSTAGTLGHLTTDEEQKLQEAWVHIFRLCGLEPKAKAEGEGEGEGENPASAFARIPNKSHIFQQHINQEAQDKFTQCLWSSVFVENPDATVLRFLRARKWDVEKAMIMLTSAVSWRYERRIEDTLMRKGESVALEETMTEDEKGFINQYRSGKSFVRGVDKEGRPIYIIRVRLHDPSLQSSQSMENYVLHSIESMRALVSGPQDKACLVFDMTGMGLKNMDYHVVKFLVTVFEARYPETLGVILIHNAPFIFGGIWRIIKGWLDPVIASKINFTRNNADMQVFIPKDNLQSCYGGLDDWEFEYAEPVPGENDLLEATEEREKLEAERNALLREYERLTIQWVSEAPESAGEAEARDGRTKLAQQLRANYWALDPYVRAKNYYKRVGVVDDKGNVDFKGAGREELST